MTRRLARALGCALFGALAGAAAMILLSGLDPRFTLEMTQDRPGLLRGFYPGERDGDLTFAWTGARAEMPLAGLDRNVSWTARIRVRGGRRDPATLPTLTVLADDVPVATRQTTNEFETLDATIPAKTGHMRGVTLALSVSNTFVPGSADGRALGVQIDRISVAPSALGAFPPRRTVAAAALGSAVFGAIFGLLAATATTAVGAATVLAVGQAAVLRIGLGPFAPWLTRVELLAASIGIALLLVAVGVERWRHERLRHTARFALMFTGAVLYLHLLVLLHPDKLLADAPWHAAQLSTSIDGLLRRPSPLYVAALPLAHVVADCVSLLWILAAVVDAASMLFFYWMIVRGTADRILAAVAVAILQLMPLGFHVLAEASLASVVGQALSIVTMAMLTATLLDRKPWLVLATCAAALLAFLSDATSFNTLGWTLSAVAIVELASGGREARYTMAALGLGLIVTGLLAARWSDATLVQHVLAPVPTDTALNRAPGLLRDAISSFGWPFLALALVGVTVSLRAGRGGWWRLAGIWIAVAAALAVLRAADLRAWYAALPPVAIFAAVAVTTLWNAGTRARALAVVATGLGAALGIVGWLGVLAPALE